MKSGRFEWLESNRAKTFGDFKRLINEMFVYYDEFIQSEKDLPYWSTEMSTVGHLAVAVGRMKRHRKNYLAVLEYNTKGEGKKAKRISRADIWIKFSKKQDILIEAKQEWIAFDETYYKESKRKIQKKRDEAFGQLKKMRDDNPSYYMALIFVGVWMKDPKGRISKAGLEKKIKKLASELRFDFWAYYLLGADKIKYAEWEKYHYPGVMIFGEIREEI